MINQKLFALTWLRGIAAFFVIVNHVILAAREQYSTFDSLPYRQPLDIANLGMFAVYLFFALSGCTLALNYSSNVTSIGSFLPFYLKRFFRIWPAFAFSMLCYLLFIEFFRVAYTSDNNAWIALFLNDYTFTNILQYLSLTFNITGPRDLFNGPYWSLPVEFQYYLFIPCVMIFCGNKFLRLILPLAFGCVFYLIYSLKIVQIDRMELFKMGFSFFGGVFLANLRSLHAFKVPFIVSAIVFALISALCGLIANHLVQMPENIFIINDANNFYGLCSLVVVGLALMTEPPVFSKPVNLFLSTYGEISYSTYLFHMLFVGLAVILVIDFHIYNYMAKLFIILCITLFGSYFFSRLTYRFVEMPSIALGARIAKECSQRLKLGVSSV